MSRSQYSEDLDPSEIALWRGAVTRALEGKRGQKLLRDALSALDALPVKELITNELEQDGKFCLLGAVGAARHIDMKNLDPEEPEDVAAAFGIAPAMAQEIVFENDECGPANETPAQRWERMRAWVAAAIINDTARREAGGG